ncbi:nucleotidyltransferase family protein [Rhodococcoides yunnanense]|uniref:nucleotidyltransferase family protein n=1 Tax=Rhodococcoides yunnanense TaxID=278209 RepID=UPI00093540B1|nr:NTP transferase domain-containing protein [Rhodococcus yunnanensis]
MSDRVSGDVVGVLLAAGAGSRYGSPKVLAEGGAWLDSAVAALVEGGCDRVVVVLGAADVPVPDGAVSVHASDWRDGMSASLKAGLVAAAGAVYAVVHVVDTPDVGGRVVRAVLSAARASPSHLARATFSGAPGHPVVFGAEHWDEVVATASGDAGAREFLRGRPDVIGVECSEWATGVDHDYR